MKATAAAAAAVYMDLVSLLFIGLAMLISLLRLVQFWSSVKEEEEGRALTSRNGKTERNGETDMSFSTWQFPMLLALFMDGVVSQKAVLNRIFI